MNRADIRLACFTFKKRSISEDFHIDYLGLTISNDFHCRIWSDFDGYGRNLPDIYKVVSS